MQRIGKVAYRLKLAEGSKVLPVFHVSLLKRKVGQQIVPVLQLPNTDEKGHFRVEPVAVLDQRIVKERMLQLFNGSFNAAELLQLKLHGRMQKELKGSFLFFNLEDEID